ncbi:MAG: HNH endonuclease [Clostridium sp.]|nr:HNH endonuclease [Clostridium sp.]
MIYKYCCKCNKKIEHTKKMCDECTLKYGTMERERYRRYKEKRKDSVEQSFYNSTPWLKKRDMIKDRDNNLCLICFLKYKLFISCDCVHHITELKEDWEQRLDEDNLICLCAKCHKEVHKLYIKSLKDKEECKKMLRVLIEK